VNVSKELLEILACPKCKSSVEPTSDGEGLACAQCAVVYPVREDIPVMLVEEAIPAARWQQGDRGAAGNEA
jgi:uncharacterized protein YbaR (Trm112 family)